MNSEIMLLAICSCLSEMLFSSRDGTKYLSSCRNRWYRKEGEKKMECYKQLLFGNQGGGRWTPASRTLQALSHQVTASVLEVTTNDCVIANHMQDRDSTYHVAVPLRTPRWLAVQAQTNHSISLIIKKSQLVYETPPYPPLLSTAHSFARRCPVPVA